LNYGSMSAVGACFPVVTARIVHFTLFLN